MNAKLLGGLACLIGSTLISGCNVSTPQKPSAEDDRHEPPAVAQTVALKAAEVAPSVSGVATVINPDTLVQLDADLASAAFSSTFSREQFARYKLTPTLSRQVVETAEKQAGVEATQLKLLETRLKQTWGDDAPLLNSDDRQKLIASLVKGEQALVRLDFPELAGREPRNVRVAPLFGGLETPVSKLWVAPSGNLSMPGVSYFGLISPGPGLRPGDRAKLIAENSERSAGVIIPSAAVIVFGGESWCYVETEPKKYERRKVALDRPVEDGYLVKTGFDVGTRVVVRGASVLLSREAGPGEDEEDDGHPSEQPLPGEPKSGAATSAAIERDRDAEPHADPN